MAENDIEKNSNIEQIDVKQENENTEIDSVVKQPKTKTTRTTTRKTTSKKGEANSTPKKSKKTAETTTQKSTKKASTDKTTKTTSSKSKKQAASTENNIEKNPDEKTVKTSTTTRKATAKNTSKTTSGSKAKATSGTSKTSTKKTGTTAKKENTKSNAKKTTKTTAKSNTSKIEKSKAVKKSKKTDDKIKQIINEQLNNVDKFEEVKAVPKKKKKEKTQFDEKQIEEQIETAKKMPKIEKSKIYKKVFVNILLGIAITVYFIGISIGFSNIETPTFVTDLKVFSLSAIAIAIIIFECAYGKDDDTTALYGIEMLFVAIMSLVLLYICILYQDKFVAVTNCVACVGVIYYLIKSISIYIKEKSKWKKTISDVKDIISEE